MDEIEARNFDENKNNVKNVVALEKTTIKLLEWMPKTARDEPKNSWLPRMLSAISINVVGSRDTKNLMAREIITRSESVRTEVSVAETYIAFRAFAAVLRMIQILNEVMKVKTYGTAE